MGHKGCKSGFDTRPLGNNNCADSVFSQEKPIRGQNVSITANEIRDTNAEYFMNERQFSGNGANVE